MLLVFSAEVIYGPSCPGVHELSPAGVLDVKMQASSFLLEKA